jgi:hypothetical protein
MSQGDDELFQMLDDLESQAQAAYAAEREAELRDRSASEYQHVILAGRLMASVGEDVSLEVLGVGRIGGELARVAAGWVLLRANRQDWIVRAAAIASVTGASSRAVPQVAWSPVARLGLGSPLLRLADTGSECVLHLVDGRRHEGALRRVGSDFVELRTGTLIAFGALAAVQARE